MARLLPILVAVVLVIVAAVGINQFIVLRRAHSSFDNYYTFRGCQQLLERDATSGLCKTNAGQTIKMVEFKGKWYLDHDLPHCMMNVCF